MIIFKDNSYQTHSGYPDIDWTGEAKFVLHDDSELANKIKSLYPYYNFVLDDKGNLIDIVATEQPPEPEPTEEEKQATHDELSIQYIHDRYSYDDENKIMREYLADMENAECKVAFEAYNNYVTECKQKAYKEIYGE